MPTPTAIIENVSEQVMANVKTARTESIKAVSTWTETVQGFLPETVTSLDVVDGLPKPAELLEMAFDFAEKVLAYQFDLARSIAGRVDEYVPGDDKPAAKATKSTKSTTKSTASAKSTKASA